LPSRSTRAARFLTEVFQSTQAVEGLKTSREQLNILYVPIQADKVGKFQENRERYGPDHPDTLAADFSRNFYDYAAAHAILAKICGDPPDGMRDFCGTDVMSGGPYLFSYAQPASGQAPLPPPYLLVDLSNVDPRAYAELLSAFRAQVTSKDFADRKQIATLRLYVVQFIMRASSLVVPVGSATADVIKGIVHTADIREESPPAERSR
jgi:hypothetical protein